jgi:hypothetical protein
MGETALFAQAMLAVEVAVVAEHHHDLWVEYPLRAFSRDAIEMACACKRMIGRAKIANRRSSTTTSKMLGRVFAAVVVAANKNPAKVGSRENSAAEVRGDFLR